MKKEKEIINKLKELIETKPITFSSVRIKSTRINVLKWVLDIKEEPKKKKTYFSWETHDKLLKLKEILNKMEEEE